MSSISRRKFITTTLATSAAAGAIGSQGLHLFGNTVRSPMKEKIGVGFISCGGRARQLMGQFLKTGMAEIVAVCDPDQDLLDRVTSSNPSKPDAKKLKSTQPKKRRKSNLAAGAKTYTDMRELLEDPAVDAVVVATCNHWHCLAAIWAMEAGKHVYVEKPLSHTQWEGDQVVAAARRYGKVCQIGTQQRSDPMQAEIKKFLHEEKALGEIKAAKVNRYGVRGSIGKRDKPLQPPKSLNYDLWLGPAEDQPLFRDKLHYDWHWDWNTGSGEMGNWGVHVLDDVRNNVFQDKVALPKRIFGGGGRVAWNDAGQTPNTHFAYLDTGTIPVVIGLTNLPGEIGGKRPPKPHGPNSGYVVICEGGEFHGQRGSGRAKDKSGKVIRTFKGNNGDVLHQKNFLEAVAAGDPNQLNAEAEVGNHSSGWCNLANICYQAGVQTSIEDARNLALPTWQQLLDQMEQHLGVYDTKLDDKVIQMSQMLEVDDQGRFVGANSDLANALLKRQYRKGFEVPELVAMTTQ